MAEKFELYAEGIKTKDDFVNGLTNEQKLDLYSLFKQATVGDVNTDRPGMLDFKGKAKWDAWKAKEGMDQDTAKQAYVDFLTALGLEF
jgi:diazepam-binding inhibitor (GABA receptor modulator, acyl-CoA-binding protein)